MAFEVVRIFREINKIVSRDQKHHSKMGFAIATANTLRS